MLKKHIGSVFQSEQELLKGVIDIHCPNGIELDPMYFKGNFYKEIQKPNKCFDISPKIADCQKADARHLPIKSKTISTMILDPPFMFGIHGKAVEYYSSSTHGIFKDFAELLDTYKQLIKEANRVLKKGGILIFKCQDYTDHKTTMVHCIVYSIATDYGFYAKDLAVLWLPKNKISNNKLRQRHLRKKHSYFWIFKKLSGVKCRHSSHK